VRKNFTLLILLSLSISRLDAQYMEPAWVKTVGNTGLDACFNVITDNVGNVYVTGKFEGTVDFDPGPGTYNLTSSGSYDIYISKADAAGNFIWAKRIGGNDYDDAYEIKVAANGNLLLLGEFSGVVDFDPGPGIYNLVSAGDFDGYIASFDATGNFVWAKRIGGSDLDNPIAFSLDPSGNICITGQFEGTADFDPGPGVFF
jgi:hypothetical protein